MASDGEVSVALVRDYFIKNGGKVKRHDLFDHFRTQLDESSGQGALKNQFGDIVNSLAYLQNIEGEKFFVLKKSRNGTTPVMLRRPARQASHRKEKGVSLPATMRNFRFSAIEDASGNLIFGDSKPRGSSLSRPRAGLRSDSSTDISLRRNNSDTSVSDLGPSHDSGVDTAVSSLQSESPRGSRKGSLPRNTDPDQLSQYSGDTGIFNEDDQYDQEITSHVLTTFEKSWMMSAMVGNKSDLICQLEEDPNIVTFKDFINTALHWAAKQGNEDLVRLLVDGGADVNAMSGYTPLHLATMHGRITIINILIDEYHANVHLRDHSGKEPQDVLQKNSSEQLKQKLKDPAAAIDLASLKGSFHRSLELNESQRLKPKLRAGASFRFLKKQKKVKRDRPVIEHWDSARQERLQSTLPAHEKEIFKMQKTNTGSLFPTSFYYGNRPNQTQSTAQEVRLWPAEETDSSTAAQRKRLKSRSYPENEFRIITGISEEKAQEFANEQTGRSLSGSLSSSSSVSFVEPEQTLLDSVFDSYHSKASRGGVLDKDKLRRRSHSEENLTRVAPSFRDELANRLNMDTNVSRPSPAVTQHTTDFPKRTESLKGEDLASVSIDTTDDDPFYGDELATFMTVPKKSSGVSSGGSKREEHIRAVMGKSLVNDSDGSSKVAASNEDRKTAERKKLDEDGQTEKWQKPLLTYGDEYSTTLTFPNEQQPKQKQAPPRKRQLPIPQQPPPPPPAAQQRLPPPQKQQLPPRQQQQQQLPSQKQQLPPPPQHLPAPQKQQLAAAQQELASPQKQPLPLPPQLQLLPHQQPVFQSTATTSYRTNEEVPQFNNSYEQIIELLDSEKPRENYSSVSLDVMPVRPPRKKDKKSKLAAKNHADYANQNSCDEHAAMMISSERHHLRNSDDIQSVDRMYATQTPRDSQNNDEYRRASLPIFSDKRVTDSNEDFFPQRRSLEAEEPYLKSQPAGNGSRMQGNANDLRFEDSLRTNQGLPRSKSDGYVRQSELSLDHTRRRTVGSFSNSAQVSPSENRSKHVLPEVQLDTSSHRSGSNYPEEYQSLTSMSRGYSDCTREETRVLPPYRPPPSIVKDRDSPGPGDLQPSPDSSLKKPRGILKPSYPPPSVPPSNGVASRRPEYPPPNVPKQVSRSQKPSNVPPPYSNDQPRQSYPLPPRGVDVSDYPPKKTHPSPRQDYPPSYLLTNEPAPSGRRSPDPSTTYPTSRGTPYAQSSDRRSLGYGDYGSGREVVVDQPGRRSINHPPDEPAIITATSMQSVESNSPDSGRYSVRASAERRSLPTNVNPYRNEAPPEDVVMARSVNHGGSGDYQYANDHTTSDNRRLSEHIPSRNSSGSGDVVIAKNMRYGEQPGDNRYRDDYIPRERRYGDQVQNRKSLENGNYSNRSGVSGRSNPSEVKNYEPEMATILVPRRGREPGFDFSGEESNLDRENNSGYMVAKQIPSAGASEAHPTNQQETEQDLDMLTSFLGEDMTKKWFSNTQDASPPVEAESKHKYRVTSMI